VCYEFAKNIGILLASAGYGPLQSLDLREAVRMAESDQGSVTRWVGELKEGDGAAAQPLWERYFARMVELARAKLRAARRSDPAGDEEDAALSAFDSFCAGIARGRFPQLSDRDDLWRLLVVITSRKVFAQARRQRRLKRGGGMVRIASERPGGHDPEEADLLALAIAGEPTPDEAALVAEEYRRLLDVLGDDTLRKVAVWRMEGHDRDEIAARLGCARRTVARQLALIRTIWEDAGR
jgi:DNA-directed RNA polymerase specialized sigma24 family protein